LHDRNLHKTHTADRVKGRGQVLITGRDYYAELYRPGVRGANFGDYLRSRGLSRESTAGASGTAEKKKHPYVLVGCREVRKENDGCLHKEKKKRRVLSACADSPGRDEVTLRLKPVERIEGCGLGKGEGLGRWGPPPSAWSTASLSRGPEKGD